MPIFGDDEGDDRVTIGDDIKIVITQAHTKRLCPFGDDILLFSPLWSCKGKKIKKKRELIYDRQRYHKSESGFFFYFFAPLNG